MGNRLDSPQVGSECYSSSKLKVLPNIETISVFVGTLASTEPRALHPVHLFTCLDITFYFEMRHDGLTDGISICLSCESTGFVPSKNWQHICYTSSLDNTPLVVFIILPDTNSQSKLYFSSGIFQWECLRTRPLTPCTL